MFHIFQDYDVEEGQYTIRVTQMYLGSSRDLNGIFKIVERRTAYGNQVFVLDSVVLCDDPETGQLVPYARVDTHICNESDAIRHRIAGVWDIKMKDDEYVLLHEFFHTTQRKVVIEDTKWENV